LTVSKDFIVIRDKRGRVSLSRTKSRADRYFVDEQPDGTIVLTPAVVVAASVAQPRVTDEEIDDRA
jgi:hypothetical protein